jgi:D-methionine transport system substrate-binding protein
MTLKNTVKFIFLPVFLFLKINVLFAVETIKIGITAGPSVHIMDVAKKIAKEKYNLNFKIVPFVDYQMPNEALNSGDLDANIFQTVSFLNQAIEKRGYKLAVVGNTFIYPMGVYSRKIKNINEIKEKDSIIIPNDTSNQGRALVLLQNTGLIKLRHNAGELPNLKDIVQNPKSLIIRTVDAAQAARASYDVTAVVLNNDFVLNAGFKPAEALFRENPTTAKSYVNVIVVRQADKDKKVFQTLKTIMNSDEIKKKTEELFPGAVPAW